VFWEKPITEAAYTVEVPICGTKVSYDYSKESGEGQPVITKDKNNHLIFYHNTCIWVTNTAVEEMFLGEICGGETYVLYAAVDPDWGYYFTDPDNVATLPLVTINGERASWVSHNGFVFEMKAEHDWDEGTVTKEATSTEEGKRVYKCKHHETCGGIKEEAIPKKADEDVSAPSEMGTDGTAIGPGASVDATDKAITSLASDSDPAGAQFAPLKLKSTKQGNNNIKLSWAKVKGATYYVVYGNACGKNNKLKRLANVKTNSYNVKRINKKLKKGKYHKFIVVAIDKNKRVISTSKIIHVATTGGKVGNHKSVTVKKAVITKAKKLKKGKTLKLAAVANKKKLKVNKHVAVRYESSNPKIATVTKKGVVKGKAKGTCYVYAYAQNGVCKRIKVTVS